MIWSCKKGDAIRKSAEQCVIVRLPLSNAKMGTPDERDKIRVLSALLEDAIKADLTGEFDGDVFGNGECELFMYGQNADKLFESIFPILKSWPVGKGAYLLKRFGPPGAEIERIELISS